MTQAEHWLVLIRHGHSEWNLSHRFTGWTDISLAERGLADAAAAGRRLSAEGFAFDEAHTSVLQRTRQTVDSLLAATEHASIPIHSSWRLNERHYGQLQGKNKTEIATTWGESRSRLWWRGYFDPPPPVAEDDPRHPSFDPLYAELDPKLLPRSESLEACQQRLLPYWHEVIAPRIQAGRRLLVASHGNTLRALIMHLEKLDAVAVEKVEVTPGVPIVCRFNHKLELLEREWLDELVEQEA